MKKIGVMTLVIALLNVTCCIVQAKIAYIRPDVLTTVAPLIQDEMQALGLQAAWPRELYQKVMTEEAFTSQAHADALALRYCQAHDDTMIILICSHETVVSAEIFSMMAGENSTVVYVKNIPLSCVGWCNLHSFFDCQWYGSNFDGAKNLTLHVGLLRYPSDKSDAVLAEKSGQAKSCAITFVTVPEKVLLLAQTCFNNNSLHFLQYARQAQFRQFNDLIVKFKKFLHAGAMNPDCFCIDTSAVLAAYGIRDCRDFDFIHHGYDYLQVQCPNGSELNSHNGGSLRYHSISKDELIFNPSYHFSYQGIKFTALHEVMAMKKKRNSKKDRNDIKLVDEFFKKNYGKPFSVGMHTHIIQ